MMIFTPHPIGLVLEDYVASFRRPPRHKAGWNDNAPSPVDLAQRIKKSLIDEIIDAFRLGASVEDVRSIVVDSPAKSFGEAFRHDVIVDALHVLEARIEAGSIRLDESPHHY